MPMPQPRSPARCRADAAAVVYTRLSRLMTPLDSCRFSTERRLNGWDGDPRFWRVENGEIVGETTAEKVVTLNNFLIWRGGTVKDFELKVEFRMNGTNSGVQYRSVELPDVGKWVLKGYQADIDFAEGFVGNVHEERGRSPVGEGHVVLSKRGQVTRIIDGPAYKLVGTIGDSTLLRGVMNVNGWNQYHIIARGPVLMQLMNGQLMAVAIDEDTKHAVAKASLVFKCTSDRRSRFSTETSC